MLFFSQFDSHNCQCQTETLCVQNCYFTGTLLLSQRMSNGIDLMTKKKIMKCGDTSTPSDINDKCLYIITYYFDFYFVDLVNIS